MNDSIRIIFMGTPDFAVPTLQRLAEAYAVVAVVTQPDRPAGRGRTTTPPPVKQTAIKHDLPVFQPRTLRSDEALGFLRDLTPDLIITAATGHILPAAVLALPTHGTLNVHASLLPRWRGAAPIQAAILAGDIESGVTILCTDEGLDTGPILSQRVVPMDPQETAESLHDRLAALGAHLLMETLPRWLSGELQPTPQPDQGVTLAAKINKEDGRIRWQDSAEAIERQIRAYNPWPGTFSFWEGRRLKILRGVSMPTPPPYRVDRHTLGIGAVLTAEGDVVVVTGDGVLRLIEVQPAGKRPMSVSEFIRGRPDFVGSRLTDQ
jgi:methionyl-tRNA formyltransferase